MYFLIDYENVNYAGLEGTEFLEKSDTVSIFFSGVSDKIVAYRMKDIEMSGCSFEICKLQNVRKNALDFYIASKLGEIFAVDKAAKIAIISADKDYRSVIDYWQPRLYVPNQLVRCKTLAKAISHVNGEGARKRLVNERMRILDLQTEFDRYEERRRIVAGITDLFSGTDYEDLIFRIVDMVILSDRPKVLYLNSLKSFGRKIGTEVYRRIKNCDINI
jgi:hypothetical protein